MSRKFPDEYTLHEPPAWMSRKMQLLAVGFARDLDDARDLLTALGLLRRIGDDE